MNCLFKNDGEIEISDKILEAIKSEHSYTMKPNGKEDVYTFNKRARGTEVLYSFFVRVGGFGNRVSDLEWLTDFGKREKVSNQGDFKKRAKICVLFKEETN